MGSYPIGGCPIRGYLIRGYLIRGYLSCKRLLCRAQVYSPFLRVRIPGLFFNQQQSVLRSGLRSSYPKLLRYSVRRP